MKTNIFSLAVALSLTAGMLAGCSGGQIAPDSDSSPDAPASAAQQEAGATADSIKIEYFNQKSEEGAQQAFRAAAEGFMAENSHITVEISTVPDSEKVLTARMASGDTPVTFHDKPVTPAFFERAKSGYYVDLTNMDFMDRVIPSAIASTKADDGRAWAMPYTQLFYGVYYHQDIFEAHNAEIPKTWDEFMALCQMFQDAGVLPLMEAFKDTGRAGHYNSGSMAALFPEGALWLRECSQDPEKIPSSRPEMRTWPEKAIQILDYCNEDVFGIPETEALEKFANGGAAMMIWGSYAKGTFSIANPDAKLGIFPLPGFTEDSGLVLGGIDACICVSGLASEEEQEAGLLWLEYLSRPEVAQKFSEVEGAPSAIMDTQYGEGDASKVMLDRIADGYVREWIAYTETKFYTHEAFQGLLLSRDLDQFLKDVDELYANNHISG